VINWETRLMSLTDAQTTRRDDAPASVFGGGGEMGALCRSLDWAGTALGPVENWSHSLRTTVSTLLNSRFPMFLWWGPQLVQIYNDAYRPSLGEGGRHPQALGARGQDFWTDIWSIIAPQIHDVMRSGEATWHEDQLVAIERNERVEEVYWTYSYSPVRDDDGSIGGTLVVCQETTSQVIGQRRLDVQHRLAALRFQESAPRVAVEAARTLAEDRLDVSFLLCCSGAERPDGTQMTLVHNERVPPDPGAWPLVEVMESRQARVVDVRGIDGIDAGVWPEPTERAVILPLLPPGEANAVGALVVGLSPRLPWNEPYREFLASAAAHIAAHIAAFNRQEEREQRDRELELERARLAFVFKQAPAFLAVMRGPEHVFELANDAYYRLVGHRDILGRRIIDALPEVRDQGFVELLDRVLASGEPFVGERVPVLLERTDGGEPRLRFLDFVYLPMLDTEGVASGVIAHGVDVTEHVQARADVERLLSESEHARAEAEEANQAKSRFLANMSHEVRTPINAVMGYTDLLMMEIPGPINPEQAMQLGRITSSSAHLLRLVDDMLDLSKVEAGGMDVAETAEDVRDTVEEALAMVAPQASARHLELPEAPGCPAGVRYLGDPARVRQILVNLLSNAVKFSDPDTRVTVRCTVHSEPPAQGVHAMAGRCVAVEVEDTGIGMAADQLERIFEPFVQVDSASTRREGGTGLGLTISRRLARLMGGDVTVRSQPGEGSVFTLWLRSG
jgi:signal transduction histidine kinase